MSALPETPEVMTAIEVARELRVSKAHVHNLINGKVIGVTPIPFIPMGRRRGVLRSTLREWMRQSETHSPGGMLRSSSKIDAVDA